MPAKAGNKTNHWSKRAAMAVLVVFLIVSNACTFTLPWQPTQEAPTATNIPPTIPTTAPPPTPAPTARPQLTPQAALPPALVEAQPLPQSEVSPKAQFTFFFNQSMERDSVQQAMQSQPPVAGSFTWVNDSTVTFTPSQPLPLGSPLLVSFSSKARATNGLALSAPVDVTYQTVRGFSLIDRQPAPGSTDVDPSSAVVVTFNYPLVALGADPKTLSPAFTLEPAAKGRGEWLNTSTYIFYPEPPLAGGVEYTVKTNTALLAADGSGWAANQKAGDWKFKTARPVVLNTLPKGEAYLDAPVVINFNQPMDATSTQTAFSLKSAGGEVVAGKFTWNEAGNQLTFQPEHLLKRAGLYTVTLSTKAQARGGAALEKENTFKFSTVPNFGVKSTEPANGGMMTLYDVFGGVRIRLTAPLAKQDLTGKFQFKPAVGDVNISRVSDTDIYVSGVFAPRKDYTLRIDPSLQDKWGQSLKEAWVMNFTTSAPVPSFNLAQLSSGGIYFITPKEVSLGGRATNIKSLKISFTALNQSDFAKTASFGSYERDKQYGGPRLAVFEKTLNLPLDQNAAFEIPLNPDGKALATGLYYYQFQSPELDGAKNKIPIPSAMLVVSRVHLALKRSANQISIWAVNLDSQKPLVNAMVVIYTSAKGGGLTQVGTAKTNEQGLAQLDYAFAADNYFPAYAVIGKPGDAEFSLGMTTWSDGINGWDFGVSTDLSGETTHTYLYTDRPIYQAGQTVDFRAMVHQEVNGRYSSANLKQVSVLAYGLYQQDSGERAVLWKATLPVSEYGTVSGSFELPDDAAPGYYEIRFDQLPSSVGLTFQVADYRKPEVEVLASFAEENIRIGKEMKASVQTNYYFGAPAGNLNVQWSLYLRPTWKYLPDNYQSGSLDTGWLMPRGYMPGLNYDMLITQGSVKTGPDGKAAITIPADRLSENVYSLNRPLAMRLQVTVMDEQELPVSGNALGTLHPADYYIGVKPDSWSGRAKTEAGFNVKTFDWKNEPVAGRKLSVLFQKVVYKQKVNWNFQSGSSPFTTELTTVDSTEIQVDGQGRARIAFTPLEPGTYQIEVSGDGAKTQVLFWVGGEGRAVWPGMPDNSIRLMSDAADYQPGQTAKVFIPNPLGEKTLAWITVERGKLMKTEVVPVSGASLEWSLPLSDEYAPNVYVSVLLLGQGTNGAPDFRMGYLNVKVAPKAFVMQAEVTSQPEKTGPGSEVKLGIRIKDNQGKPVTGEFSLSVVDKAVLALADPNSEPIADAFYGNQPLGIQNSLSLAVFGRARNEAVPLAAGGRGGGGGDVTSPMTRSNFQDTAYWNGKIVTDANGYAEISVKLPDNLTTWVITTRGITRTGQVGEALKELVVSKDLLIRPVAPRFLVVGDRIQLAATVNNTTAKAISADVNLQVAGVELESASQAAQKVEVPAQGRARVTWWARVQDVDNVDLVFSARGGGFEDSSRPTGGSIPVVKYSSPVTFGTAGLLSETGERVELINAPRSFNPTGGELKVELSSSLGAAVLSGLKALDTFPYDFTEPVLSRLLPNLVTYQALQKLGIASPELRDRLEGLIQDSIRRLVGWQNQDGGWGWQAGRESDPYLSAYTLFGLSEATKAGVEIPVNVLKKAGDYIKAALKTPAMNMEVSQLDRLAFQHFALQQAGRGVKGAGGLYEVRERLSPWARALLALVLVDQDKADLQARSLLTNLQTQALRSATGAHWETTDGAHFNLSTPVFTTAVVSLALARLDPKSPVLTDAVRYLALQRRSTGCWASSYESAWVLMALTEAMSSSGELNGQFTFAALLNDAPVAAGKASGPEAMSAVQATIPLLSMRQDGINALKIVHDTGTGRLYYRAFLKVYQPAEQAQALQRGISVTRAIYPAGVDCVSKACQPVSQAKLSDQRELLVRLTVTVPQAVYHLVLEDFIPAGAEIVDTSLKTMPKNPNTGKTGSEPPALDGKNPFGPGWNWWWFGTPQIYRDHIRWVSDYLAAGTYQVTYRLMPLQAGEFRLLPAHAYETYFPEVEGSTAGAIFRIEP